ncbi:MAG: zinc-dependent metalloprotease [Bacteroidota bacterium]
MRTKITSLLFLATLLLSKNVNSQGQHHMPDNFNSCGFDAGVAAFEKAHPEVIKENEAREKFIEEHTRQHFNESPYNAADRALPKYRIPVVVHIFGSAGPSHNFWGHNVVDAAKVAQALQQANNDFQGLNADYATVHNNFKPIRGSLDISFELAKKDPNGNSTTGIVWRTASGAGLANTSVAAYAWDNKKYYNIYIVADLYNDGNQYNSGYTLYPNVSNTNSNLAKTVYNGQYLGVPNYDTDEFASTFAHELAHAMNCRHTFENGCNSPGDYVADTPPVSNNNLTCHSSPTATTPTSTCSGTPLVNVENYMDYSGRFACYKMFTQGQVTRMDGFLNVNDVTLRPLWQQSNLIATGLLSSVGINLANNAAIEINVFPNPAHGIFQLDIVANKQDDYKLEVKNILGSDVYTQTLVGLKGNLKTTVDLQEQPKGVYFVSVSCSNGNRVVKVINE